MAYVRLPTIVAVPFVGFVTEVINRESPSLSVSLSSTLNTIGVSI